jgi:hypothetical protein
VAAEIETILDTSCILAWLIEQGYDVYAFLADVGQEEVRNGQNHTRATNHFYEGFRGCPQESPECWSEEVLPRGWLTIPCDAVQKLIQLLGRTSSASLLPNSFIRPFKPMPSMKLVFPFPNMSIKLSDQ